MKKSLLLLFLLLSIVITAGVAQADIVINEIMTNNGVFTNGERYDWIELYNNGKKDVSLAGWGLSDKKKEPMLWQFPKGTVIKANGYLLVYCVGEDPLPNPNTYRNIYYAPFKLSHEKGENIVLTDKDGNQHDLLKYPPQFGNTTYGRSSKDGEWGYFDKPTLLAQNANKVFAEQAQRPEIETPAGFYTLKSGEDLEIVISGEGKIHYTLDGSEPTRSSAVYTRPIKIDETTVVRARTCDDDKIMSPSVGATYIVNDPAPVAVISLSSDYKYLYDPSTGVFVRGSNKQSNYMYDWEYPMYFEYFDVEGNRQLAQNVSFHISGTSTRGYSQKSVSVYARDAYGDDNRFYYNPFPNRDYPSYKSLLIRSTGSDVVAARIRDAAFTSLAKGLDIMYQDAVPCLVYVNGQYYGHYNLREKVNKHSVAQWEGVDDEAIIDHIDILEGAGEDHQVQNGDNAEWLALREYVKENDLSDPVHLKYVTDRFDVDSYFTWVSLQLGYANTDLENVRVYRLPGGKWKYILYDVEAGGVDNMRAVYMLMDSSRAGGRVSSHYSLLRNLLKSPEMKDRFLKILAHVMENSFLYETTVDPVMDYWETLLNELLPRHFQKHPVMTIHEWRANVRAVRYGIRVMPRKAIREVCNILKLTDAEKEAYFGRVLDLMDVHNSEDKQ